MSHDFNNFILQVVRGPIDFFCNHFAKSFESSHQSFNISLKFSSSSFWPRPVARIQQQGDPKQGPHYKIQYWMYAATGVPGTTAFTNKYISMLLKGKNRFRLIEVNF